MSRTNMVSKINNVIFTSDLTTWKNVDATRLHKIIKLVQSASYYCLKSLEIL